MPIATRNNGNLTVAFDTWTLNSRFRNQGIYVYAKHLLTHLRELAVDHSVEVRPFVSERTHNDANAFQSVPGFQPRETGLLKFDRLWRYGGAWMSASWQNPDVFFCPTPTTVNLRSRFKKVVTVHDVSPVVMPVFAPAGIVRKLRYSLGRASRSADAIIAISIQSKQDLIEVYGLPESKIHVVYSGYDKEHFNTSAPDQETLSALLKKHEIGRPYLFHHGMVQPRKNLKRLMQAYRMVRSRNRNLDFDLVLAGALGWGSDELVLSAKGPDASGGKVIFTGPLSDADLATLLKGATLAVIPSLYEGFCLPMVEAMACGVPTIAANASCLPEISGGVLRYFSPESVEEMADCIEKTLEDAALRKELSEKGMLRAHQFDWRRCAEQTLDVLIQCGHDGRK